MSISVHTEITDASGSATARDWIFYDAECDFCCRWIRRTQGILDRRGFVFVPLQTPWALSLFGVSEDQLLVEMQVLLRDGRSFGGADAIIELAKHVWWAWPLVFATKIAGVRKALHVVYRQVAARRSCSRCDCSAKRNGTGLVSEAEEDRQSRRDG